MADFGKANQTEDISNIGSKNLRRPKLDLSFASFGYPQQHRISPTYSDCSDPLHSYFLMGSRSNTPDDSDMSNSPETTADILVSVFLHIVFHSIKLINFKLISTFGLNVI